MNEHAHQSVLGKPGKGGSSRKREDHHLYVGSNLVTGRRHRNCENTRTLVCLEAMPLNTDWQLAQTSKAEAAPLTCSNNPLQDPLVCRLHGQPAANSSTIVIARSHVSIKKLLCTIFCFVKQQSPRRQLVSSAGHLSSSAKTAEICAAFAVVTSSRCNRCSCTRKRRQASKSTVCKCLHAVQSD